MNGMMRQDAQMYYERDMSGVDLLEVAGGHAGVYSVRCPGKETPNEDVAGLIPVDERAAILVVADGVGGVRGGEQAADTALETIKQAVIRAGSAEGSLRPAILDAIEAANHNIQQLGIGAATTLAVVEIRDGTVRPYHVGDSMILVVGQRGRVKLQTVSHSPVGFALESGLLEETEAMQHEERHLVSNVLGASDMRIEIGSALPLAPYDTLLLASDGLSDNLQTDEIVERLRKGPLGESIEQLANDALQRMTAADGRQPSKPDDLTILAFRPSRIPRVAERQPASNSPLAAGNGR